MSEKLIDLYIELQNYLVRKEFNDFKSAIYNNETLLTLLDNYKDLYKTYKIDLDSLTYNMLYNDNDEDVVKSCNELLHIISKLIQIIINFSKT